MKTKRTRFQRRWVLVALLVLASVGCATFEYRNVQSEFEEAVISDNAQLDPVIDRSEELYRAVAKSLTDERIAGLDPKLRANAWMIRAFSEWRSGQLAQSRTSATAGLNENPVAHSRDDILLHLIPALIIDSEIMIGWIDAGRRTDPDTYRRSQERDFATAIDKVDEARARIGPPTPRSTAYYVEYQNWRILQNWRLVISKIPDRDERRAARDRAKVGGKTLAQAAHASRDSIPQGHPLRQ